MNTDLTHMDADLTQRLKQNPFHSIHRKLKSTANLGVPNSYHIFNVSKLYFENSWISLHKFSSPDRWLAAWSESDIGIQHRNPQFALWILCRRIIVKTAAESISISLVTESWSITGSLIRNLNPHPIESTVRSLNSMSENCTRRTAYESPRRFSFIFDSSQAVWSYGTVFSIPRCSILQAMNEYPVLGGPGAA